MTNNTPTSPVETPTTPSTPHSLFPSLPRLVTTFTRNPSISPLSGSMSMSISTATATGFPGTPGEVVFSNDAMRRRNSSIISIPSSPLDSTVQRPLPVRPAKMARLGSPGMHSSFGPSILHTTAQQSHHQTYRSTQTKTRQRRSNSPPPRYHMTIQQRTQREHYGSTPYAHALFHLRTPLVPLISVSSGLAHPEFPSTLLQYHLLTHGQLDSLSRWYHQVAPPVAETWRYPTSIPGWVTTTEDGQEDGEVSLETKRRRWGRFIGLRGCESPMVGTDGDEGGDLVERMEREWRRALERREEEERLREKGWRGRW